jgi:hypothetical protein
MEKIRLSLTGASLIALVIWVCGCGGRGPIEEGEGTDSSSGSSTQWQEGPDTPGAASSGPKYEKADPRMFGHTHEWPEADEKALVEIEKQKVEADTAYLDYMRTKEAGNPDESHLQRGIQLYEQIQTKLDPLMEKYPEDKSVSELVSDVGDKLRILQDDLRVK